MTENSDLRLEWQPDFPEGSALVIGWNPDAGRLGGRSVEYLRRTLGMRKFAEIGLVNFFALTGVAIEEDVAQFPECKFYCVEKQRLVTFEGNPPRSGWYRFLQIILDMAQKCSVREIHTLGGMISLGTHTVPRQVLGVANGADIRGELMQHGLAMDMDYETPPGQRPTLSSYMLWAAKQRDVAAASLWTPVPFYLAGNEDPQACRRMLGFLDYKLRLGLDFNDLDAEAAAQDDKLAELRRDSPQIDAILRKLENNQGLTQEENEGLAKGVDESLRKRK